MSAHFGCFDEIHDGEAAGEHIEVSVDDVLEHCPPHSCFDYLLANPSPAVLHLNLALQNAGSASHKKSFRVKHIVCLT